MPVSEAVMLIDTGVVYPVVWFGGDKLFMFDTSRVPFGEIIYTEFDRCTYIGLCSYAARYGSETTIAKLLGDTHVKNQIDLRCVMLPKFPASCFS